VLLVGDIYRLKFPGFAARVIVPPSGGAPSRFPFLVESLLVRSRWYVNERGESSYTAPRVLVDHKLTSLQIVMRATALLFVVYFSIATYLYFFHRTYRHPPPPGAVLQLTKFRLLVLGQYLYISKFKFGNFGDTPEAKDSPFVVYENDQPLGPAHAIHHEIETLGMGRFSHWKDLGIVFSTSDNSDPRTNERDYWVVLPAQASTTPAVMTP
jgi:hypothetical protein